MTGLRVATIVGHVMTVGLGALSNLLFLAAFQFRPEWFADPAQIVTGGSTSALLLKWAALTDLFSYLPEGPGLLGPRRPASSTSMPASGTGPRETPAPCRRPHEYVTEYPYHST